jgi:NAD(P)H-hydrate epimerase
MRALDAKAAAELAIPGIVLMENAARSVCEVIEEWAGAPGGSCGEGECTCRPSLPGYPGGRESALALRCTVVCGKGNNGGDGLAIARLLANRGARVNVILLARGAELKGDARTNWRILRHSQVRTTEVSTPARLNRTLAGLADADVIVDAIFGTGFAGRPEGLAARAIQAINRCGAYKVAVDIPSGVCADEGQVEGIAVKADCTVTMGLLKRGLALYPGKEYCGDVWIGDIGVPTNQFAGGKTFLLEEADVRRMLPERSPAGHKGTFGAALVIAGSPGFTGAASLASLAALRVGAGLARLVVPRGVLGAVEARAVEVVKYGMGETAEGALGLAAGPRIERLLADSRALAIGPGIGLGEETRELEFRILRAARVPMVVDADAVSNLAGNTDLLRKLKAPFVLTPHPGELERLIGMAPADINRNRIEVARKTAQELNGVLVLKGAPTVVAAPDGRVWVNSTGNSGMGSGGTGDVLTGAICGLLCQGMPVLEAALAGVYLHGLAGDLAADEKTEYGLIAGDVLEFLPRAIAEVVAPGCD